MLNEWLTDQTVQVVDASDLDWRAVIRLAAQPLVTNGSVITDYVDAMVNVVEEQGPYINIGEHIALAHTRPEDGAKKISLALLKTAQPVSLVNDEHLVTLWFVLSAVDSDSHLEVLKQLMQLLMDEQTVQRLKAATTAAELVEIIQTRTL
ncbi:PTS sugar transporter subunit IIA [Furfurilactobacillus sp. WILCCON 0119]